MSVSILGAGSWGTALALLIARNDYSVTLWGHRLCHMAEIESKRCNTRYLPEAFFPENIQVTADLKSAVEGQKIILIACPSHSFSDLLRAIKPHLVQNAKIAWATKGLEKGTGRLLHEVALDILGRDTSLAVLSGPTFAKEVAANQPTAITLASNQVEFGKEMVCLLHNNNFRAYTSQDMIGVQLGGATKNVLAIAAGVAAGLGFGANARAALITRGLAEMMRLGLSLGGKPETFMGLAGVGDLILTCTDNQSRNRHFGLKLGQGMSQEQAALEIGQEIEGISTAEILFKLAGKYQIEMPITEQICKILHENLAPLDAVNNLLMREPKSEV